MEKIFLYGFFYQSTLSFNLLTLVKFETTPSASRQHKLHLGNEVISTHSWIRNAEEGKLIYFKRNDKKLIIYEPTKIQ